MARLQRDFFERDTVEVAQALIGCKLIRRQDGIEAEAVIVETEAYKGSGDPASHAARGVTPRNRLMFGPPGILYVYFSYGMHHCMNIVTEPDGVPGAVLLRAAVPVSGLEWIRSNRPRIPEARLMDGPGKLTQALAVDLALNGFDVCDPSRTELRLEAGEALPFQATTRIGISKGKELPWRFAAAPGRTMPPSPGFR
ncbi:DNA-3-methyladenine glycosylase [Gorillibacterium sp. sgz5001074]|uniref:DNA-3-methyladenine glycosylase n=1 Tax=Gorillibacterium sp. sgz5001074 TaxID=3446695 RepID=UPI003F664D3A